MDYGQMSLYMTHLLVVVNTCTKYEKNPSGWRNFFERSRYRLQTVDGQGKSERFNSCHRPNIILLNLDSNHWFFSPYDPENRWMNPKSNRALLSYMKLCVLFQSHQLIELNSNWSYSPETPNWGQNWRFFVPCDLQIWRMNVKNNRAPLLCYFKLCASYHTHRSMQSGVTVRKCQNAGENRQFSHVTLKFDYDPEQGKSEGFDSCDRPSNLPQILFKPSIFQPA